MPLDAGGIFGQLGRVQIPPPVQFAERDGGSLAFQVLGEGDLDLVTISDPPTHLDLLWTDSGYVDVLLRFAEGRRLIAYDRRGVGLSDGFDAAPTLEAQALDLEAVLDAAGSERAVIFGYGGSAAIAAYFAATRPERVVRLILLAPWDRNWSRDGGGWEEAEREQVSARLDEAVDHWGQGLMLTFVTPRLDSPRNRRLFAMLERASVSRGLVRSTFDSAIGTDISAVLTSVRAPALVIRHRDNPIPAAVVSRVAEQLPESTLAEVDYDGDPRAMADFWNPVLDAIDDWLPGTRSPRGHHATFTSVLFTDIVGSTTHAARLGDKAWRELLVRHENLLREQVNRHGGRLVKTIGDGSLSSFDGPVQAIRCALGIDQAMGRLGLRVRAGVHAGECERIGLDLAGMAVHVAARVEAQANAGEVLVTRPSMDLCAGSGLEFDPRGRSSLAGVPGEWELFAAHDPQGGPPVSDEGRALRRSDRAVLAAARRAPGILRVLSRIGQRRR